MLRFLRSLVSGSREAKAKSLERRPYLQPKSITTIARGELGLLAQFVKPKALRPYGVNGSWEMLLDIDPLKIIDRFIDNGWLVQAPLEAQISRLKLPEIKEKLSGLGLSKTGNKADLSKRLAEANPNIESMLPGEQLWECSDVSRPTVDDFLAKEEADRNAACDAVATALQNNDLKAAAQIAAAYDATRLFPSVNPNQFPAAAAADFLKRIKVFDNAKNARPQPFIDIEASLFAAAANECIWSSLQLRRSEKRSKELDVVVLNLWGWRTRCENLARYKESKFVSKVKILCGDSISCDVVRPIDGKSFPITQVPELPLKGCTRLPCCACTYVADLEDLKF